jgi:hypothetical protein
MNHDENIILPLKQVKRFCLKRKNKHFTMRIHGEIRVHTQ